MSNTKDNNKKPFDNQAANEKRNHKQEKNMQQGKHSFSKETDHL